MMSGFPLSRNGSPEIDIGALTTPGPMFAIETNEASMINLKYTYHADKVCMWYIVCINASVPELQ